jgi:predicted O-linked N-acetylglucosamine transferase (SPINDLY family)
MAESTNLDGLRQAIQHHQAGRLSKAETLYRAILARDPHCVDALHYLGVIAHQVGQHAVAVGLIRQAEALAPANAAIHSNLGEAYRHLGRLDEAVACLRQALALRSNYPDALNSLGLALTSQGQLDNAIVCFEQAIALKSNFAEAHNNLGNAFEARGQFDRALACYQLAIAQKPDLAEAHSNLGNLFRSQGRLGEALACYRRALTLQPDFAGAHNNLGNVFKDQGHFDEALACFQRALALKPDITEAHHNLGHAFKDRGQLDDALASYRQALALQPDRADFHSDLLLAMQCRFGDEPGMIGPELAHWNQRHARSLRASAQPHNNDRSPDRQLRIGYLSRDFLLHPVAHFLLPLLQAHDRAQYHLTGYSLNARSDAVTARFQACTDEWRCLAGMTDEEAARVIREDRIDLLVELSGHTTGNRLLILARKPAPVQLSYLGYPGATGLESIDYRITDPCADPRSATGTHDSEPVMRLPETAWCFAPLSGHPSVGPLPAMRHGYMSFGCFNNFAKVTEPMLHLWLRILKQVPQSRLTLKNQALNSPAVAQHLRAFFARGGVSAERLELVLPQRSPLDHLKSYDRVDLALDTFPYHGTTTTCEALWMGVPVLTLAGHCHVARVGVSLLTNVGLPEFVAPSADAYLDAAVAAARDLPRLAALRGSLRERMQRSPLMDAPRFARNLEAAYREMWRRWCAQAAPSAVSS